MIYLIMLAGNSSFYLLPGHYFTSSLDTSSDFNDTHEIKRKRKRDSDSAFNKAHIVIPEILGEAAVIFCESSRQKNLSYSQCLFI